jgi:excisionase family DNA binding protein
MSDPAEHTAPEDRNRTGPAQYTVPEAAQLLGISDRAVRKRIAARTLTAERVGKAWEIPLDPEQAEPQDRPGAVSSGTTGPALDDRDVRLAALEADLGAVREELRLRRSESDQLRQTIEDLAAAFRSGSPAALPASIIEALPIAAHAPVTQIEGAGEAAPRRVGDSSLTGPSSAASPAVSDPAGDVPLPSIQSADPLPWWRRLFSRDW